MTENIIDLSHLDDIFAQAEVKPVYKPIPDGNYHVEIKEIELTQSKESKPMLKWTLRIIGPAFENRFLWRHNLIVTDENITWLKTDLYKCGLNLQKLSTLHKQLDKLVGVKLEVSKKTKGEFENIYFNHRIDDDGNPYDIDDGDIPF